MLSMLSIMMMIIIMGKKIDGNVIKIVECALCEVCLQLKRSNFKIFDCNDTVQ